MTQRGVRRAVVLGLAASYALVIPQVAQAGGTATNPPIAISTTPGKAFTNYDFESTSLRHNNVDWAVSLYVYNGASIDRFKYMLGGRGFGANSTDSKHGLADDGAGYKWDSDAGKKGVSCPTAGRTTRHYRVYADNDQYMYSPTAGTFVYASTHRDRSECALSGKRFYDSEVVEGEIVNILKSAGCPATHDYQNFRNYERYRSQGSHVWDNNGYASYIDLGYNYCR